MAIHPHRVHQKSLHKFIEILRAAGVRYVLDVRLRNTSQLAGCSR
jgi:hypothetical protein